MRLDPQVLAPLVDLATLWGLEVRRQRCGPCPVCKAETGGRHDRRPPITIAQHQGQDRWFCHADGCGARGTAPALLAAVRFGRIPNQGDPAWQEVYAELRGDRGVAPRPRPKATEPAYPPRAELQALWGACRPVDESSGADALRFLEARRLGPPEAVGGLAEVREIPRAGAYPWPRWFPRSWAATWRLVVPAYTPEGSMASLHARAVVDARPKTRWPADCAARELLFADWAGARLLRRDPDILREVEGVLVVEGVTDLVRATLTVCRSQVPLAVIGATSGGFPAFGRVFLPEGLRVYVATDVDPTGDRYAQELADAIYPRKALRLPLTLEGRSDEP